MIIDYTKKLLLGIFVVILLLGICVTVDYADDPVITTVNQSQANVSNCTVVGGVHFDDKIVKNKTTGIAKVHKIVHIKPKYPVVSMWARPSVRCNLPYKWYYRSFIDYCPHCRKYGVLYNAHKPQAKHEQEWTCRRCGADYDGVIGKEKYSWSHYYLRRV